MATKIRSLVCLLFITLIIFISGIIELSMMPDFVFAQEEDHGHDHAPEVYKDKLIPITKRKGPFKGYGKQGTQFKKLCEAIKADDRLEILVDSAKEFSDRDPACEACRNFMQSFTNNCKSLGTIKVEKTKKDSVHKEIPVDEIEATNEDESTDQAVHPTPTPVPNLAQREPSALVIDRAVRLFEGIASDEDLRDKTLQALNKLKFVIMDKNRSTQASREYYENLFTYIYSIFQQYESSNNKSSTDQSSSSDQPEVDTQKKSQHLESLFDQ